MDSDESLMEQVRQGNRQAFAALVRRHSERFYGTVWRITGNRSDAEDIVQNAFLKIWERPWLWQPGNGAHFTGWFYRICVNMALDTMRRKKYQAGSAALDFMADAQVLPDQTVWEKQKQAALERALRGLPEKQRAALALCVNEGLSQKEAAQILGVRLKALESLLSRARTGLRDSLARSGYLPDREGKHGSQQP